MTPGTPDQSSSAVISPAFVHAWANGSVCGVVSAPAGDGVATVTATAVTASAAHAPVERRDLIPDPPLCDVESSN